MNISFNLRRALPCLIAGAVYCCQLAEAQTPVWSQLPNSPSATTRHDDIYMLNESIGYTARGRGGIFKTTDGGNTWVQKLNKTDTHFRCIGFATATHGWAGNLGPGSYDTAVTETNVLFETFDGGDTWTNRSQFAEAGMQGLCSLHVFNAQTIYGVGRVRGPAHFIKSVDAGTNWTILNLTNVMGALMDVYFKDPTNGFVVGMSTNTFAASCGLTYYGRIARTTNGGASWFPVATTTIPCCYFWKMSWPTPNVGYVSLQQNVTGDPVLNSTLIYYKTTDGGVTWVSNGVPYTAIAPTVASSFDGFYWQGVGFITTNEGWAGGSALAAPYNFLHTTNGGASWTTEGYNNSASINRIRILSPTLAYASGQKIQVFRVPLAITIPPTNQSIIAGSNTTLTVTAFGSVGLAYQWRFNGTNLAGANTNFFNLTNVQATNAGNYDVVVSDYSGSITSAVATLSLSGLPGAPVITTQPQSQVVNLGSNATFSVSATGTAPLSYQWRFNGTNILGATNTTFLRTNVQSTVTGNYLVVVTNVVASVTSSVATLALAFVDDFDGYVSPVVVTNTGTTNGYKILFGTAAGADDFKVIFGFNYSTVTYPSTIPSAPHSIGGTTKGLYLAVNKDANGQSAAVNLYPVNQTNSGNFALKFDLWLNWASLGNSTEHALFGINHSGQVLNRILQSPSDGLFYAMDGDGNVSATATTLRDFAVYHGGSVGIPFFMNTNSASFGPTPPLGPQFDNLNAGFAALFPAKTISGFGTTLTGSPGLGWVSAEVRQENDLITWLLNGVAVAQYTNTFGYTNGVIFIGYSDNFPTTGDANSFAIFDNLRVESLVLAPVKILSPFVTGNNFAFSFVTEPYESYTVQWTTNLAAPAWQTYTSLVGNGTTTNILVPLLPNLPTQQYFRVNRP